LKEKATMNNMVINNIGLVLSIGASFVGFLTALVPFIRFLFTRFMGRQPPNPSYGSFPQGGYITMPPQRGIGHYFGCTLQAIIAIVIIIAGSTICTYITVAIIAVYLGMYHPGTYPNQGP